MEDKKKLLELIERERKQLDEAVKIGLDGEKVYEQSVRLDRMIDEYYKMLES
ncbi:MAG: aspartyl-phosphate phosphatase Spo0E family protein [Eubacterium sp.]